LRATGRSDADALPWLQDALATARALALPGLVLRAAVSLAPVWAGQGRQAEALALLDECMAAMPDGAPTADLQQARTLRARMGAPR
jgi:hypothetical protein